MEKKLENFNGSNDDFVHFVETWESGFWRGGETDSDTHCPNFNLTFNDMFQVNIKDDIVNKKRIRIDYSAMELNFV